MSSEVTSTTNSSTEMSVGGESRAECQRYLISFRVHELKELLKSIGCSQRGRKNELFQRSNELLQHGSPKIQNKIREIYDRSHYSKRALFRAHRYSPVKPTPTPAHSYIVHPDVNFKQHPFYQKVDSIIRPTALLSTAMASNGSLSMRLQFHLTPQQVQEVYHSKTAQGTYQTQVLLRFCRQETSCYQDDYYPKQCYVKINSQYCPIPGYHPHLSTRPDYKRSGSPINITNYVKTSAAQANDVVIYWGHDILYPMGFCVCVDLVHGLSASELLQGLKSKGVRSPDVSRALVREKLMVDRDSEIATTSLRVSLLCPLGKMRMVHPCRSSSCTHLQCFDAGIYLQMNEKKARWVCPVCDKAAPLTELVIDGLFMEICEKSSSNDIKFETNGSWHAISEKDVQSTNLSTPPDKGYRSSFLTIGDTPEQRVSSSRSPVVIDLTLSSDEEDDDPLPSRPSQKLLQRSQLRQHVEFQASVNDSDYDHVVRIFTCLASKEESAQAMAADGTSKAVVSPPPYRRRSSSSSRRRISSSSSTASGYSSDTQDRELPSSTSVSLSVSQGTQPVSVITHGHPHSSLAPYHLLHNELHSAAPVPAMVDDALFTTLLGDNVYSLFSSGLTPPRLPSPISLSDPVISLD